MAGVFCLVVTLGGVPLDGMWLVTRGWAVLLGGWFLALTLLRPEMRLTDRALAALGGALAGAVVFLVAQPQAWGVLDWVVKSQLPNGAWGQGEESRHMGGGGEHAGKGNVADTCVSTLALIRSGSTARSGAYQESIRKGIALACTFIRAVFPK